MKYFSTLIFSALIAISAQSFARDDAIMYSIEEALATDAFKEKLDGSVKFYFGSQKHASIKKNHGEFVANRKTNAFNKSDEKACQWAFLSALLAFQDRAKKEGGDAVVNITSYYKKNEVVSNTEFECHAGKMIAGVALKGDAVSLK